MEENATKICRVCGEEQPLDEFPIRTDSGKRRNECRQCKIAYLKKYRSIPENKNRIAQLNKSYREAHKEELTEYWKNYQRAHLDKFRQYNKKHRDNMTPEQKERTNAASRRYVERHKNEPEFIERRRAWHRESSKRRRKKITAYAENRKRRDPVFKLKTQIRNDIRMSFNRRGFRKSERTEVIVGCTLTELYEHLCMTYKARYGKEYDGKELVHIDHIIPLANARTEDEVKELCRWDNLQLLTAEDNLIKNANEKFPTYKEYLKD